MTSMITVPVKTDFEVFCFPSANVPVKQRLRSFLLSCMFQQKLGQKLFLPALLLLTFPVSDLSLLGHLLAPVKGVSVQAAQVQLRGLIQMGHD